MKRHMVKRFVVRAAADKHFLSSTHKILQNSVRRLGKILGWLVASALVLELILCLGMMESGSKEPHDSDGGAASPLLGVIAARKILNSHGWTLDSFEWPGELKWSALLTILIVFLSIVVMLGNQQVDDESPARQVVLSVYPIGIQLDSNNSSGIPTFVPREDVVDCVVTEIIRAHCVFSTLVIRVRQQPANDDNDSIRLIPAFPGVEMTYKECLTMRHEINKYLRS